MLKILTKLKKEDLDRDRLPAPKSVQDLIPVSAVWDDGIFELEQGKYSKTYQFTDINYNTVSEETRRNILFKYVDLLNSFDNEILTKITIDNRYIDADEFQKNTGLAHQHDGFDDYRDELNGVMLSALKSANMLIQDKYITVTVNQPSVEEARNYFTRLESNLQLQLQNLNSTCKGLDAEERLAILARFFNTNSQLLHDFSLKDCFFKGHSFKDYVVPDGIELIDPITIKIGDRYARVLFMEEYANFLHDQILTDLAELRKRMIVSIDILPVNPAEAVKEVDNILLGIDTNITKWQQKQFAQKVIPGNIPPHLEQEQNELRTVMKDLTENDQKLMLSILTIVHVADSKEQLDRDTAAFENAAGASSCRFAVLRWQQIAGLQNVLPYGVRTLSCFRTLTTKAVAAFMPFRVENIMHEHGLYFGQNQVNLAPIIPDKSELINSNAWILAVPGGGKSMTAKQEIIMRFLRDTHNVDIIIIDPEREYTPIIHEFGGETVCLSPQATKYINALQMDKSYGHDDEGNEIDPIPMKSQFIMSLIEQSLKGRSLTAEQESIIDRCVHIVYKDYIESDYTIPCPTLVDLRQVLLDQPEPEAKSLALALEMFTSGSLNLFAKPTTLDTNNSLLCYDLKDLTQQLSSIGMLIMLDTIWNRLSANRDSGRKTYIFVDEIYLLFQYEYSARFLQMLWKRVRKYGGSMTGITQNITDLLDSSIAQSMLANSEFIVMLKQAGNDRERLRKVLNIPDSLLKYVTDNPPGTGLIKVGANIAPFVNHFPQDTKLYKLMTTKPDEIIKINKNL